MPDNISSKKRPVFATIIAILLLIPTPFVIFNSVKFFNNPLHRANTFDLIPRVASKFISRAMPSVNMGNFLDVLSENLKEEYTSRMSDPKSSMRKIETYKFTSCFIIALATIFICIGILRLKRWAYKPVIIRSLVALFLVMPLTHLSAKHMKEIMVSGMSKSLYELPLLEGDEKKTEIVKAMIQDKTKKQGWMPVAANTVFYLFLIGYFLHPGVRKTFNKEGIV